jgi:hypothetical protein
MRFLKNLVWIVRHRKEIEALISKNVQEKDDKRFALGNVPEFQKDFVNKVLNEK